MGAIYRRELGAFFSSSMAYIFLAVFYLFAGWFFYGSSLAGATTDMSAMFSSLFMVVVFLIPILTMKLFSEELKQKTDQGLLTAPVSLSCIVLGKYFAALTLYTIAISITLLFGLILSFFGTISWGICFANFLALFLLGAAFISVGLLVSALTENQIVAAVGGFVALMLLYMIDVVASYVNVEIIQKILTALSFYTRYYEFTCGLFNLPSVLFYISVAVIFNFLTIRVFERRRWA